MPKGRLAVKSAIFINFPHFHENGWYSHKKCYFHNFSPFVRIEGAEKKIASISNDFSLDNTQRGLLKSQYNKLQQLREGSDLRGSLETGIENVVSVILFEAPEARDNQAVYAALARAFVAFLHEERFEKGRLQPREIFLLMIVQK